MAEGEYSTKDLLLAAQRRIRELEEGLRFAEGFIMGAVPKLARDRNEAVAVVLPRIRAALYGSAGVAEALLPCGICGTKPGPEDLVFCPNEKCGAVLVTQAEADEHARGVKGLDHGL